MTGYVADLSWKSGARAIEKLDRLRSTMAVNVLINNNFQKIDLHLCCRITTNNLHNFKKTYKNF